MERRDFMLKTLGAQIKEYKNASIATPVFMLLEVLMETIIPLLMASIIDDGVNKGDTHHIYITDFFFRSRLYPLSKYLRFLRWNIA